MKGIAISRIARGKIAVAQMISNKMGIEQHLVFLKTNDTPVDEKSSCSEADDLWDQKEKGVLEMDIKEFAGKFVKAEDDAFQRGDFTALSKMEDPNVVYHMGPLGDMVGHEAHKNDILGSRQACSDIKQEWKYVTGEGNLFVMDYKSSAQITGEKPGFPIPIGKKLSTAYLFVIRVADGKVKEAWANGNMNFSD